jgi:hypothetical protein
LKVRNLYKCLAMYQREAVIRYTSAFSDKQAKMFFVNQLAREHGVEPRVVMGYFLDHPDRVSIMIETEFEEVIENEDGNKKN